MRGLCAVYRTVQRVANRSCAATKLHPCLRFHALVRVARSHTIRLLALLEQASRAAGSVRTAMTPACVLEKVNEITMREIDVEEPFTEQ